MVDCFPERGSQRRQAAPSGRRGSIRNGDKDGALALAQRAKAASPADPRISFALVQMLMANQHAADAEAELRSTVAATPGDADRWLALVEFLVVTKQMEKADNEVQKAQQAIKDKPLSVARCCELLGQAYKSVLRGEQKAKVWTEQAARWYAVARNADPRNHDVIRQYIDFLLRSGDLKTAKARLDAIRSNATPADAEERAWATRTLALTLASSKDEQQRARSVELLQASDRPEDLRAFATVCEAQHKPEYDQKARAACRGLGP